MIITCPCGMAMEEKTTLLSWPPYRLFQTNKKGKVIYAVCVHGVVVIDRLAVEDSEPILKMHEEE